MSRRPVDDLEETAPLLTAHYELLESAVSDQLGPLAGSILRALHSRGALTLRELASAVKHEPFDNPFHNPDAHSPIRSSMTVPPLNISTENNNNNNSPSSHTNHHHKNHHHNISNSNDRGHSPPNHCTKAGFLGDASVKEVVARLLLHRVLRWEAETHTYALALGEGLLLRVLFPMLGRFFQRRYGEAGVTLLAVFHELAIVPWEAAVRLAMERRPVLADALRLCAREMERLGLIEFVAKEPLQESGVPNPTHVWHADGQKRPRDGGDVSASPDPCRLHVGGILREMFHYALVHQFLAARFADGGVAAAIVGAFLAHPHTPTGGSLQERANGYPPFGPRVSASLPLRSLAAACEAVEGSAFPTQTNPHNNNHHHHNNNNNNNNNSNNSNNNTSMSNMHSTSSVGGDVYQMLGIDSLPSVSPSLSAGGPVLETVQRMCRPDGDSLLRSDGTAQLEGPYRLRYDAAVEAMRRDCWERLVFARHGVLGVRLLKLLLQHRHAEDRMLAEEAIATLPRTREVLHAMMRDGFVRQQEVPRGAALADRPPKSAVFLWGASAGRDVLPTTRFLIAKTLRIVLARLATERRRREGTTDAIKGQKTVDALEGSAAALMEMMLVMDYY